MNGQNHIKLAKFTSVKVQAGIDQKYEYKCEIILYKTCRN